MEIVKNMKVLFLNYEYPPLGGGAANATAYVLEEYAQLSDLEVHLVTSSVDDAWCHSDIGGRVFIHRLPIGKNARTLHYQSLWDLLRYLWSGYFFSRKILKQHGDFELVHAFFSVPCGFQALLLKQEFRIPYIVSLRGADVPGYSERFSLLYILLKPLIRLIWRQAARVVANSQGLRELALRTNRRQRIGVIGNGIDISRFFPRTESRPQERCIITSGASRVTARKGLEYLIRAIAQLKSAYTQLLLKIMGDGNDRERLEKLVKELALEKHVEFLGRVPREMTAPYYQEASVFVLPSQNEGMSNAMLEALASGLPIIATDTGGSRELVKAGENGFIIKKQSSEDIAEKLRTLLDNPDLINKFGAASRKRAEELSWAKVAQDYVDVYKDVTSKKSS